MTSWKGATPTISQARENIVRKLKHLRNIHQDAEAWNKRKDRITRNIDKKSTPVMVRAAPGSQTGILPDQRKTIMKVLNSLRSAKKRHRDCKVIRRKGKVYVINKTNPRFKARQG